ncbi:MAG: NAD(P)-binding domain-containing protein [Candidatus Magasanikbacteria bacterium]
MKNKNIAIIGCGSFGTIILEKLKQNKCGSEIYITRRNTTKGERIAEEYGGNLLF